VLFWTEDDEDAVNELFQFIFWCPGAVWRFTLFDSLVPSLMELRMGSSNHILFPCSNVIFHHLLSFQKSCSREREWLSP
jgi:hypothetical protein